MNQFSKIVIEALRYYVYCLVDPRNHKIFYIGKECGNRIFAHANDALNEELQRLKLDTVRAIKRNGLQVEYYILRHNMTEKEAYLVESTLIDLLTYNAFNLESTLTNIASAHHQWDEGIKTADELEATYTCDPISMHEKGTILLVNLNKSFDQTNADGIYKRPNLYEVTRKYWRIGRNRPQNIRYVLGVYRSIVRSVIEVDGYQWVEKTEEGIPFKHTRCCFEGELIDDSSFLNKDVSAYPFGSGGATRYI